MLEGLDEAVIDRCREERVTLMPGARALVQTMRAHGAWCLLVSGGFTRFAEPVAAAIGFDAVAVQPCLTSSSGRLAGTVAQADRRRRGQEAGDARAPPRRAASIPAEALAVGDGANDIPMLKAAGLGIAYRAKPAVAAVADARIEANDLTALLYAQGYARKDWVEAEASRGGGVTFDRGEVRHPP